MKRILTIGAFLFLLVMLGGCTQYDAVANEPDAIDSYEEESHTLYEQEQKECHTLYEEELDAVSWAWDEITFSSVEDFLNAYIIANAGGDIAHLISEWYEPYTGATIASSVANVNFTSLEAFYLPVGIPDEFEIHSIAVNEEFVNFTFLHQDDMISEDAIWDALRSNFRVFRFSAPRGQDVGDPMEDMLHLHGVTEEALIDGEYLFVGPGSVVWALDNRLFYLYIPSSHRHVGGEVLMARGDDEMSFDDQLEAVRFAETVTINLQDTRAVEAMIAELEAE